MIFYMKYIYTFLYLTFSISLFSQFVVDESNNPIPYLDVLTSNNKAIYYQTDIKGRIPLTAINSMKSNDTLFLHHISFSDTSILRQNIKDTIFLKRNAYTLKEIAIHSKTPKYQKITACFRNTVIQDGHPLYYSDGKADYLTKNKNINYKLFRSAYRAFENRNINKYLNNYKTSIQTLSAYTPIPEAEYLPYQFIKKHNLILSNKDSLTTQILTLDSIAIGEIKEQKNTIAYQIVNVFDLKSRKALNTEVELTDFHVYMVFRKGAQYHNINSINNFNELLYLKKNYGVSYKHDKDKVKQNVETIEEIFVEQISFIHDEDNDYTKSRGMPRENKYSDEFWNECDCELYYPHNEKILEVMKMR